VCVEQLVGSGWRRAVSGGGVRRAAPRPGARRMGSASSSSLGAVLGVGASSQQQQQQALPRQQQLREAENVDPNFKALSLGAQAGPAVVGGVARKAPAAAGAASAAPATAACAATPPPGSAVPVAAPAGDAGFVRRKGGKRPPKDPSLSVEERLAQALHEQEQEEELEEASVSVGVVSVSSVSAPQGSIVSLANQISVPVEERPTRRLRPKAPSSKASSVCSSRGSGGSDSSLQSVSSAGSARLREPVTLRTFELLKVLGKGSHGKVFLVRHRGNGRMYAMKQLKKADVLASKQLENTRREFKVHMMLCEQEIQCPNIAPLRFAFHSRSRLYMVFDYCAGGELYFHIGQRGRLPEALARFYAAQIALAIGYLHSNGVAYRDLKPENLLLDGEGNINVVDLGLCKDGMRSATQGSQSFCGTTEYLAPEILNYQEHGLAVDWWSYGMVLYEMLTGLPPWYSYKQEEVVRGILGGELTFPPYVSEPARELIAGLLCRDPAKRLGSARGVEDFIDLPFFKAIDWVALARRELRAPFRPPQDTQGEACNFDVEFTSSRIEAERDHVPPVPSDPFGRFYYDSEDPVHNGGAGEEQGMDEDATDPAPVSNEHRP
jgi:serine/threonine protein kinase